MTRRRHGRVDWSSFDDLDAQLGADRGPSDEPSSTDFLVIDLPCIVDTPKVRTVMSDRNTFCVGRLDPTDPEAMVYEDDGHGHLRLLAVGGCPTPTHRAPSSNTTEGAAAEAAAPSVVWRRPTVTGQMTASQMAEKSSGGFPATGSTDTDPTLRS